MVEIANEALLADELVMRGGTCLHKLHLPVPYRYSEDLDYVRRTTGPIGPYLDALRAIAERVGLEVASVDRSGQMVHMILDAEATDGPRRIRIKIETNIAETEPFRPMTGSEHSVSSRWWAGSATVPTFVLDEMIATKLRALYQRRKGRDLFDIWLVLTTQETTPAEIVAGLGHYMREAVFTYPQLRLNLLDVSSALRQMLTAPRWTMARHPSPRASASPRSQRWRPISITSFPLLSLVGVNVFESAEDPAVAVTGSESAAASVLSGGNKNGRTEWRDAAGRSLKELQEQSAGGAEDNLPTG